MVIQIGSFSTKRLLFELLHHYCCLQSSSHLAAESIELLVRTTVPPSMRYFALRLDPGQCQEKIALSSLRQIHPPRSLCNYLDESFQTLSGLSCEQTANGSSLHRPGQKKTMAEIVISSGVACSDRTYEVNNTEFKR
jgi:hypothetical protein